LYRVIILAPAQEGLDQIPMGEADAVLAALGKLLTHPEEPKPYRFKQRREGWEMYVGRWKITYELRRIELIVYVHGVKESPSLAFDYRY
jgi:mRNA-degrading endonuclease RelE of RelBE toxin-antitoxin system